MPHTETPWRVDPICSGAVVTVDGLRHVATCYSNPTGNAAFIALAGSLHDDLLAVAKETVAAIEAEDRGASIYPGDWKRLLEQAKAAISAAEGGAS